MIIFDNDDHSTTFSDDNSWVDQNRLLVVMQPYICMPQAVFDQIQEKRSRPYPLDFHVGHPRTYQKKKS